jgi:hypothetical protein
VRRAGEDGGRAVGIEAGDVRGVGTEDAADLLRDGREHLCRRYPAGDERGDAAQRRLLVGEPAEFVATFLELGAALGVGDRGRDEFGEAGHALFGVGREAPAPPHDGDHAPQMSLDDDRSRDPRLDSHSADGVTGRARGLAVIVGASRAAGAQDLRHGACSAPTKSRQHGGNLVADHNIVGPGRAGRWRLPASLTPPHPRS